MINPPVAISAAHFHHAWLNVLCCLKTNNWKLRNLIVHIENVSAFDSNIHMQICDKINSVNPLKAKQVAYTIFPHRLYEICGTSERLYKEYNKPGGFYDKHYSGGWGNYFRRMTNYSPVETAKAIKNPNQLKNIIAAINTRRTLCRAAYTIIIPRPGGETTRKMGGPCLNYIAIQLEPMNDGRIISLLCVYRNHDFIGRAYGNYWGLCNLTRFIAQETNSAPGPLTCISSNAYIENHKSIISELVHELC